MSIPNNNNSCLYGWCEYYVFFFIYIFLSDCRMYLIHVDITWRYVIVVSGFWFFFYINKRRYKRKRGGGVFWFVATGGLVVLLEKIYSIDQPPFAVLLASSWWVESRHYIKIYNTDKDVNCKYIVWLCYFVCVCLLTFSGWTIWK